MAVLELQDITDFVAGTLRHLGRMKFQQIAQELQTYEVVGRWFKKDKVQFDHGSGIQRNLMSTFDHSAQHVGATHVVTVDIPTLMDNIQVNWRHVHVPWAFLYYEILTNRGDSLVFNVIKPRRLSAMLSLAKELEAKAWQVPSSTNKTEPYGLPYWIVYNATTGFTGAEPSGHTTVGGVNLTDSPNFKNYSVNYAAVTKTDLIPKLRTMFRKIMWRAPVSNSDYTNGQYNNQRIYMNESRMIEFENLGEGQNENLGRDIAPYGGARDVAGASELTFRKLPLVWIPQMDDTAVFTAPTNPVYMIDHSTFYPVCLSGDFMREMKPRQLESQPNMFRVDTWLTYNYLCVDRRRNGVAATAA